MIQFIKCPACGSPLLATIATATNLPKQFAPTCHYRCKTCGCNGFEPLEEMELIPALSIKQPWAWLIVNGYKDLENRSTLKNFRGDVLIHASKGFDKDWMNKLYPEFSLLIDTIFDESYMEEPDFEKGGIIGIATITNSITQSSSYWFSGPNAFVIENARPLPFTPCKGALGFFTPKID